MSEVRVEVPDNDGAQEREAARSYEVGVAVGELRTFQGRVEGDLIRIDSSLSALSERLERMEATSLSAATLAGEAVAVAGVAASVAAVAVEDEGENDGVIEDGEEGGADAGAASGSVTELEPPQIEVEQEAEGSKHTESGFPKWW